jgi:GNAT superfamily N-acetyltransferase
MDRRTLHLGLFDKWGRSAPWGEGVTGLQFWPTAAWLGPTPYPDERTPGWRRPHAPGRHVRSWQAAYAHVLPAERLAELSVERRARQWRDWPPLLAESGDVVVGFVSVGASRDADADGELFAIYVDPDHRGRWSEESAE